MQINHPSPVSFIKDTPDRYTQRYPLLSCPLYRNNISRDLGNLYRRGISFMCFSLCTYRLSTFALMRLYFARLVHTGYQMGWRYSGMVTPIGGKRRSKFGKFVDKYIGYGGQEKIREITK